MHIPQSCCWHFTKTPHTLKRDYFLSPIYIWISFSCTSTKLKSHRVHDSADILTISGVQHTHIYISVKFFWGHQSTKALAFLLLLARSFRQVCSCLIEMPSRCHRWILFCWQGQPDTLCLVRGAPPAPTTPLRYLPYLLPRPDCMHYTTLHHIVSQQLFR